MPISTMLDEKPVPELNSPMTRDQKTGPSSPVDYGLLNDSSPTGSGSTPLSLPASSTSSVLSSPASSGSSARPFQQIPVLQRRLTSSSPYAPAVPPAAPAGSSGFLSPASPPAMGFVPGGSVKLP